MIGQISLQEIIDADWSRQYLTADGTVASRSWGFRLIKWFSTVHCLGQFIPKPAIYSLLCEATTNIKMRISDLSADDVNGPEIKQAATKINQLVDHIAQKRSNEGNWDSVKITLNDPEQPLSDKLKPDDCTKDEVEDRASRIAALELQVQKRLIAFKTRVAEVRKRKQEEEKKPDSL